MSLLIQESPLIVLPKLAQAIGLNEAIVLQQVHYWVAKSKDMWVYNSYEQWQADNFPFWSIPTIKRIVYRLEEKGLLISKQEASTDRKKYYTIAYDKLDMLTNPIVSKWADGIVSNCNDGAYHSDTLLITETTTETTKEKIKYSASSQKSDEPLLEYITLDALPIVKNLKNSDNKPDDSDNGINAYDNDTYLEFTPDLPALSTTKKSEVTTSKPLSKPRKLGSTNNSDHYRFYLALCELTKNEPALQLRKVHGMSKKLMQAGYTIQDLKDFKSYWQRDWRYTRDKRAPTPEELYTDIEKSRALFRESVQEDLSEDALKDMFEDGQIPEFLRQEKNI